MMKLGIRILAVSALLSTFASSKAVACNMHPPDVSHERWLAQISQWNKEYDAQQAAKAQLAATGERKGERAGAVAPDRAARTRAADPQVRVVGQGADDDARRARRYR